MNIKYPIEIEYMKYVLQINEFSDPRPWVRSSRRVRSISGRDRDSVTQTFYDEANESQYYEMYCKATRTKQNGRTVRLYYA